MKIGFFLQNNKQGGLDTFVIQLLSNWPEKDDLVLFCNASHPGRKYLESVLYSKVSFQVYDTLISQDLRFRFKSWPSLPFFFIKSFFWLIGTFLQVIEF